MSYELTCPTCQARLLLKEDAAKRELLCPRCLTTMNPQVRAPETAITVMRPTSSQPVPTIEKEVRRSKFGGYLAAFFLILIAVVGIITAGINPIPVCVFLGLIGLPAGLIVQGILIGRQRSVGGAVLTAIMTILLLILLLPVALVIVIRRDLQHACRGISLSRPLPRIAQCSVSCPRLRTQA